LKLLCAIKNFICDFETQLFHREIGLKHWRTKTNDNAQLAENVVILLLTFCGLPKLPVLVHFPINLQPMLNVCNQAQTCNLPGNFGKPLLPAGA